MVVSLLGTPYMPDPAGAVLMLEETREEPYRVDRMLTQLRFAGVLNEVGAVVAGDFRDCVAKDPGDGSVNDVIDELASVLKCPLYRGLPYGHGRSRCVLPVGAPVRIEDNRLLFS